MTGKERLALGIAAGTTLLNVPLNLVLIPPYGVAGAVVASAFCLVLWNLAAAFVVWRWLGIVPGVLATFVRRPSRGSS